MIDAKAVIVATLVFSAGPAAAQQAPAAPALAPSPAGASAVTPLLVLPNNPTRAVAIAIIDGKPYVCHLTDITSDQKGGNCVAMSVK